MDLFLVIGKGALSECERYFLFLTRLQLDFCKTAQLADRSCHIRRRIFHIELNNLFPGHSADVFHLAAKRQRVCVAHFGLIQTQIAVSKAGIAQAVAEGKQHVHFLFIIIAIADEHTLGIVHHALHAGEVEETGVVGELFRPCLGQLAAGILLSVQQLHRRLADALPAEIHAEHGPYLVDPLRQHWRAAVQHDYCIGIDRRDGLDQRILVFRHSERFPVKAFALKAVGQTGKHNGGLGIPRGLHSLTQQGLVRLRAAGYIALRISDRICICRVERRDHALRVDMAAAAALIARRRSEFPDKGDLAVLLQRQRAVVLQQHRALGGDLRAEGGALPAVDDGISPPLFGVVQREAEHIARHAVKLLLAQLARLESRLERGGDPLVAARHVQVEPGLDAAYGVLPGAPVGDHKAVEAPALAKNVGEEHLIVGAEFAIDGVVRAHNAARTALLHHRFKGRKIDFMERALGESGIPAHAKRLLVIGRKMLDAGGDSFLL